MEIHISVRNLVEFLLREGDIDNRKGVSSDQAMQEGTRLHRMIQKSRGTSYQAEVPLSLSYVYEATEDIESYSLCVEGRADGIDDFGGFCTIEEIKCTYKELRYITEPAGVHLAQARCYAYIYALQNDLPAVNIRMTYCNIDSRLTKEFETMYSFEQLREFYTNLMMEYKRWSDYEIRWTRKRDASILNSSFPFPYREGQRELVSHVYNTIVKERKLFIEAPTGVGKTISTVYPAVQALGRGLSERIFYLTAKTITGKVAVDTIEILRGQGVFLKNVFLTAKEKVCPLEEMECNPVACPYAKGHFDRINEAIYDLLMHEDSFDREILAIYAEKHQVCPFEMGLDMSLFADIVICDYNYLFDPHVRLQRFFAEGVHGSYTFLIDEAHNLVERGRDMYSAELYKEDFLLLHRLFAPVDARISKAAEKCNKILLELKKGCSAEYRIHERVDGFTLALSQLFMRMQDFFDEEDRRKARGERRSDGINTDELRKEVLDLYFDISHFLLMYEYLELGYKIYTELLEDGRFVLHLFCVDPSELLLMCMQKGRSTILFSATLLPIEYYKKLLGHLPGDYEVYAHSVFDPARRGLFIAEDVTSLYKKRSEDMYRNIAGYILSIARARHGNYMVFFPSHSFMMAVLSPLRSLLGISEEETIASLFEKDDLTLLIQKERMLENEREEFLSAFSAEHTDHFLIGMCVVGGIFSEGIDLRGDSLIGAVIVGTGMPQVGPRQTVLKDYFEDDLGRGFDYAYRYPGMNKVMQAAGRVIRTAEDVGIVALLDERFLDIRTRRLFPLEWGKYTIVNKNNVESRVNSFWNEWLT